MLPQQVPRPRSVVPQDGKDRSMFAVMVLGIPFGVGWLCGVVLPYYHNHFCLEAAWHIFVAVFVAGSIAGNVLRALRTDPSGKVVKLPHTINIGPKYTVDQYVYSQFIIGWHYCSRCELNLPPRSYHCKICNECVLKRDHHCRFFGLCIGHRNHRFYLVGLFYIWVGAAYGVIYHWDFAMGTSEKSLVGFLLCLLAPHFALVFRQVSLFQFMTLVLHDMGMVSLVMTTYLLGLQLSSIYRGQTLYERKHNVRQFDLGPKRNFKEVLGKRWLAVWFMPFVDSPLPGDGMNFALLKDLEEVKNV